MGSVGPAVADVQRRLAELGFACHDDPGVFDAATLRAVRAFQQQRGLPSDGIVGEDTWRSLVGASFRLGDRMLYVTQPPMHGDDVRDLQRRLNRLGFDAGYDDGLFGAQTYEAVREFQLNVGLDVDGIAGPATFDLLARLHRQHQAAPAYVVRERESLRRPSRRTVAGARVMVDPSHGMSDPGVLGPDGACEHEVTWQIAAAMEGQLAARGAHVVLSRGPTTSPTPSERAAHANAEDVEAILSIHVNEHPTPVANGLAGHYFGSDLYVSDRGRALAETVVDRIVAATGSPHLRTHRSTASILRESRAPAAVIEVGFLTHPHEGRALLDPLYQRLVASAIVEATIDYLIGESVTAA